MKKRKKIFFICGARPNFMKIAPIIKEIRNFPEFGPVLVHTGQHYDKEMSDIFFKDLGIPKPDIELGVGSGTHAQQTAKIMIKLENVLLRYRPMLVLVVGDVNSTLAAAIVSAKLNIPIAHVEAGLRSFDRTMPEEINRILTDALSQYLFTTDREANFNLEREGILKERIFFVGNVMIDTLILLKKKALEKSTVLTRLSLCPKRYALLTLHRPPNVDNKHTLDNILSALKRISKLLPIIFVVHPRTQKQLEPFYLKKYFRDSKIILVKPQGYLDFLNLMVNSNFMLTDSGGIQEETTVLGIPCLTLRENTERPITISEGTNTLVGNKPKKIIKEAEKIINGDYKKGHIPKLWDGKTAKRIISILKGKLKC